MQLAMRANLQEKSGFNRIKTFTYPHAHTHHSHRNWRLQKKNRGKKKRRYREQEYSRPNSISRRQREKVSIPTKKNIKKYFIKKKASPRPPAASPPQFQNHFPIKLTRRLQINPINEWTVVLAGEKKKRKNFQATPCSKAAAAQRRRAATRLTGVINPIYIHIYTYLYIYI